jgi:hypothetical protein
MVVAVWFVVVVGRDEADFADPDFADVVVRGPAGAEVDDPALDAVAGLPLLVEVADDTLPVSSPELIPEPVSVKKSRQIGSTLAGSARNC